MNVYKNNNIKELIKDNSYVGRGIVIGKSQDGNAAVCAYFIMGRSENSRNRIFTLDDGVLYTKAYDESKVSDPSLIIYAALREYENKLIVTNGNQTDTVYDGLKNGLSFAESLKAREFEPDGPIFTPRISGILNFGDDDFTYSMSILKSADENGTACARYTFDYPSVKGVGHFIHTYICDGDPVPVFVGEPERVEIGNNIDEFTNDLWEALDKDNKISLYVRYTNLKDHTVSERLINKNEE